MLVDNKFATGTTDKFWVAFYDSVNNMTVIFLIQSQRYWTLLNDLLKEGSSGLLSALILSTYWPWKDAYTHISFRNHFSYITEDLVLGYVPFLPVVDVMAELKVI